jgi:hypothetical protein
MYCANYANLARKRSMAEAKCRYSAPEGEPE